MKISVIIVNYNVKYYLAQCLYSLRRALRGIDAEVIVVDNDSKDGSLPYLERTHPWVRYVEAGCNLGFSKANNLAIRESRGEYVLLLNPDTVVGEHVIGEALQFMDAHPKAGGVGVRMLNADGSDAMESRRGIPTPSAAFWKMVGLCHRYPSSRRFARYYMSWLPWDCPAQIEIMSGAFCLMRKRTLDEVGLLDEDFFMYGEDIDLSYRIVQSGWENWYLPLRILHYKGESTQKTSFRYVTVFYKAMLIFVRKHFRHFSRLMFFPLQMAIYLKAFSSLVGMQKDKLFGHLKKAQTPSADQGLYVFHVSYEHKRKCEVLAAKNGLRAVFVSTVDGQENKEGWDEGQTIFHVYDMSSYQFEEIFREFQLTTMEDSLFAFWYPNPNCLVTNHNILFG